MRRGTHDKEIARERIEKLFTLANECFRDNPILADRYVELARRIGMKCQTRIPKVLKMRYCKECGTYLVTGVNSRVRIRPNGNGKVVITCLKCGTIKRYPIVKEKLQRRSATDSAVDPPL